MSKRKNNYDRESYMICDTIMNDFMIDVEEDIHANVKEALDKMPMLIDNNRACKMVFYDDYYIDTLSNGRIAMYFIQKYNKKLKKYRQKLNDYEFGGTENRLAQTDLRLYEIAESLLDFGTYFAQLDDKNYMCLDNTEVEQKDYSYRRITVYFIGKKWKKYSKKLQKMLDEYQQIKKKEKQEAIVSFDTHDRQNVIFKPMDQLIMNNKDEVIKYVDNWVNSIPMYYDKYKMIAKLSIMLYGDPGTGKSTFAKSLAKYLDIQSITQMSPVSFSMNTEDNGFKYRKTGGYPNTYTPQTVYTIDDIDTIAKDRQVDGSKENNAAVAALLAFLDNPPTFYYKAKNGKRYPVSIVVATTNYYDKLDPAVKRYGRFDLTIEMTEFDAKRAQEMCDIYDLKLENIDPDCHKKNWKISPSKLQAICLQNIDTTMKSVSD